MTAPLRIDYSSAALNKPDRQERIDRAMAFCDRQGWEFGIQIHNSTLRDDIEPLARTGLPLSFHAPVCADYFINLAAEDIHPAITSLEQSYRTIRQYGGALAVFHGFVMSDVTIENFTPHKSFDACRAVAARDELTRENVYLCRDFFDSPEFQQRLERVRERIATLGPDFPEVLWCIENDFPCYGAGLLLAEHAAAVQAPLCLDTSHLWIAALLFGRDFMEESEAFLATGQTRCVHFHANTVTAEMPVEHFRDGHRSITTPNAMQLPTLARMLRDANVNHWVLETPEADLPDLQQLADWLG